MVAYNFAPRFAEPIRSGDKTHTVRRNAKRRHARIGESLQLYTGMRTKACRKILNDDPVCTYAAPIRIQLDQLRIESISIQGVEVDTEEFAVSDGFRDAAEMHAFFLNMHGPGVFAGTLIEWNTP